MTPVLRFPLCCERAKRGVQHEAGGPVVKRAEVADRRPAAAAPQLQLRFCLRPRACAAKATTIHAQSEPHPDALYTKLSVRWLYPIAGGCAPVVAAVVAVAGFHRLGQRTRLRGPGRAIGRCRPQGLPPRLAPVRKRVRGDSSM
jgi:hypothetical protein